MPQEFIETPESSKLTRAEQAAFNAEWIESVIAAGNGDLVKTSAQASTHIRRRIRENLFVDEILNPEPVTEFDRFDYTDLPGIIEDMEPDNPGAVAIPFSDAPSKWLYRGDKFTTFFCTISTPIATKNVDELRTYKMDLRQVITDNFLKDLGTLKDIRFMQTIETIVGTAVGVGAAGVQQNFEVTGGIRRVSYAPLVNYIQDRELNNGIWLMNRHTASEFLKWDHDEMGGKLAEDTIRKGLKALQQFEMVGVPHLATIKRGVVADDTVYQFTEQDYLGRHYVMQDTTMHVKKEIDMLEFHARAKYGISLPMTRGINKVSFTG